jgi:PAS domain S-box-containing protein
MLKVVQPYMRAHFPGPINFYYAYLEDIQSEENPSWESQAEIYRRKYAGVKMDVVIANVGPSLRFAVKYREKIFPGAPIVFVSVNERELEGQKIWPGVTGVTNPLGFKETIDLALRLHPDTKAITVISGVTNWDSNWLRVLRSELVHYQDKVKEIDLVGNPNRQMLERISALPPHTLVMFQMAPQFSDQPDFGTWDLLSEVAQRFPTYSVWPRFCVNGCIGGVFKDPVQEWKLTADLAMRVLSGERPEDIPIVHNSDLRVIVDWQALQRWHIPESALPPGSIVLSREPTLWEQGRKYFIAGITLITVQALLIFGLLWQRARRRKTEAELRRSEEKFSKSFRQSPLAITIARVSDGRYVDVNESFEERTGWRRDEVIGRSPSELGLWSDPNQRSQFLKQILAEGNVRNIEVQFRRRDGETRTSLCSAELVDVGGESCILSVIADITERKEAEEALTSLSGRLIEAQEEERSRIAREIHDDYQQRLAMLSIDLEAIAQNLGEDSEVGGQLHEIWNRVGELGSDLHSLSHRLHSSTLDNLGLVAALRSLCAEFQDYHSIGVAFHEENVARSIPRETALCLFRITQEALQNIKKHSRAELAQIRIEEVEQKIHLCISDFGSGFDSSASSRNGGIGIRSMEERVRLVGGQIVIHSRPMEGTQIDVWVPVEG